MTDITRNTLPAYCQRISQKTADDIFRRITEALSKQRFYREVGASAKVLAERLELDARQLSAVAKLKGFEGFSELLNSYRLQEACRRLTDPATARFTSEEVGLMVGYASRQAFYKAFKRTYHMTPGDYRLRFSSKI